MSLRHVHDESTLGVVPSALTPLQFWVPIPSGPPIWVSLRCFAEGSWILPGNYGWDFEPRPDFARSFAVHIAEDCRSHGSYTSKFSALKKLFCFLDEIDPDFQISSIRDLTDAHGAQLLLRVGRRGSYYKVICSVVARMRERESLPPLLWPAPLQGGQSDAAKKFDPKGVQRLFNKLKREALDLKLTLREGVELAGAGQDPRNLPIGAGDDRERTRANLAWLARDAFVNGDLGSGLDEQDTHLAFMARSRFGVRDLGPTKRGVVQWRTSGHLGKLRWFAPSKKDMLVYVGLFLFSTGWNLDTAAALDVTGDWCRDHPGKPDFKILTAYKARSHCDQVAISRADAEWRPYRIVLDAVAMTEPLRAIVRRRLAEALTAASEDSSTRHLARIKELEALVRSPWLYFDLTPPFRIKRVVHGDALSITQLGRDTNGIRR